MNKLLIVVDYQRDFVDGALGFAKAVELEQPIAAKIAQYRQSGGDVAFTFDTHDENYMNTQEGRNLPIKHCIKDTEGFMLYGQIAELLCEGDRRFFKPSFGSAELFEYIKATDYEHVELVGVVSNICVISNAVLVKTALPEAVVIVDAACTAGNDDKLNNAALDVMEGLQIKVVNR